MKLIESINKTNNATERRMKEVEENYIEDLTFKQLVEFITDLSESSDYLKETFDYDDHIAELLERLKRGTVVSRQEIIRTFNNLDRSDDFTSINADELYTVDLEDFLREIGL